MTVLEEHIALAMKHGLLILVHTPHLEDKLKGTMLIMDALRNQGADPGRVLIDHVEEHTVRPVLDRGFWAGMTLYPDTKCTPQRAADIFEMHGTDRLWINSAGDWGVSDPLAVPKCQDELRRRGHLLETIRKVSYDNPRTFLSQSGRFSAPERA
jgi:predicted metal-dependent TIM-barrel fold hydrolase